MPKKFDFSGYATKNNIKCTDGRIIQKDAFKDNNGQNVPLVFQHMHHSLDNVLGHVCLENRAEGVYAYGVFNETKSGKEAKEMVRHGDITSLSIFANNLSQNGSNVVHGNIKEVSLVLAGANPGATIDNLNFEHSDGSTDPIDDEAIIHCYIPFTSEDVIEHEDKTPPEDNEDETIEDVIATMSDKQKNAMYFMLGQAIGGENSDENVEHSDDEGGNNTMKHNAFEEFGDNKVNKTAKTLTHDQFAVIMQDAKKPGNTLKSAILAHTTEYGIENIGVLFPDAKTIDANPEWLQRNTDWVDFVLKGIRKSPFAKIKSTIIDMDIDTARAKGYVKGTEKKETYLKAAKRETSPTTIYVKQKLDRDDIIDVTDFNIVEMVRKELKILLDEEFAVAALIGDGREIDDEYKVKEDCIRPIWTDDPLYSIKEKISTKTDYKTMVKEMSMTHKRYKGSGNPVLFTTADLHTQMLWIENDLGIRVYPSDEVLCAALRVSAIVEVPHFENKTRTTTVELDGVAGKTRDLLGIKLNLSDYVFGTNKGGEITAIDDFDIDFNQFKYLLEGRSSGALKKPKSAQVFEFERP